MENRAEGQSTSELGRVLEELELRVRQGDVLIGGERYSPINENRTYGTLTLYVAPPLPISHQEDLDAFLSELFPQESDYLEKSRVSGHDIVLGRLKLSELIGKRTTTVTNTFKPMEGPVYDKFSKFDERTPYQTEEELRRAIEIIAFPNFELAQITEHPRADIAIREGVIDKKLFRELPNRQKLIHSGLGSGGK